MSVTAEAPSRAQFIRAMLRTDPSASYAAVAQAWKDSGQPGEIKNPQFYGVKGAMIRHRAGGKRKYVRSGKFARPDEGTNPRPRPALQMKSVYLEIEAALDALILGPGREANERLKEALVSARRLASSAIYRAEVGGE